MHSAGNQPSSTEQEEVTEQRVQKQRRLLDKYHSGFGSDVRS